MSDLTPNSPGDQDLTSLSSLKERLDHLAREKSSLELLINLMHEVGVAQDLDRMIDVLLVNLMQVIGGTNLTLYYLIDDQYFSADVLGHRGKATDLADPLLKQARDQRKFLEIEDSFEATELMADEFTKSYTWIVPLSSGQELVGLLKVENLMVPAAEMRGRLSVLFNYLASVLSNHVNGQSRLMQAYRTLREANLALSHEIEVRKRAEKELSEARDRLELRVKERTLELQVANELLENELVERKRIELALEENVQQLKEALEHIKTLRGIVPICSNCKKIRDDDGFWQQVEVFVRDHTEAEFSHGLCPECVHKLYPDLNLDDDESPG